MKKLTTSLTLSLRILRATMHRSQGWRCSTLKIAFHALIRSKLNYATPAWQPWLSATNISSLDCLQNCALRLVTGQLVSTPLETLRLEADVQSYNTCSNRLILRAQGKALRSSDDHPKRLALTANASQRLPNHCSFCCKANDFSTLLPAEFEHRQLTNHFSSPSWQFSTPRAEHISTFFPAIAGRADDTEYSLTHNASYQADYIIYTDGSAAEGAKNVGAAAVITRGPPTQPEVLTTIKTKGRTFTSFYKEEAAAMESA